ncbi:MAG TPA: DUF192 domain-containing protein, partial [Planctomicrobium sp.]|nr:DUF192 domain-containing protein [Planctomicrobium sp.]
LVPADGSSSRPLLRSLELANDWWSRFRGLQFRRELSPETGLLLLPCCSIHTHWMRFAIDVLWLNRSGEIMQVDRSVSPWRMIVTKHRSHAVLEIAACGVDAAIGDRIAVSEPITGPLPSSIQFLSRRSSVSC